MLSNTNNSIQYQSFVWRNWYSYKYCHLTLIILFKISQSFDPRGFNKERSSKFREVSRVRQTPEEGRRTYRPKRCGNNNKDEDNTPKTLNGNNHPAPSFYTLLNDQTLLFQTVWLRINHLFTLSLNVKNFYLTQRSELFQELPLLARVGWGTMTNKEILHFPQRSRLIISLVSYGGYLFGKCYLLA